MSLRWKKRKIGEQRRVVLQLYDSDRYLYAGLRLKDGEYWLTGMPAHGRASMGAHLPTAKTAVEAMYALGQV